MNNEHDLRKVLEIDRENKCGSEGQGDCCEKAQVTSAFAPEGTRPAFSNLSPLELRQKLYSKRARLRDELNRVNRALDIVEKDQSVQNLIFVYQAAQ